MLPKYDPTDRGLYSYGMFTIGTTGIQIGRNLGTTGSYEAFFIPTQTGTYTLQFYFRRDEGSHVNFDTSVQNVYPNPPNTTNITQTPVTTTSTTLGVYQLITHTFTVTSIVNMVIGVKLATASSAILGSVTGFQVMLGTFSTAQIWNTNDQYMAYDDISAYVESASGQLGMSSTYDNVAAEGTLNLTLRNTTKIFSPENSASPFYSFDSSADPNFPSGHYPYTFPNINWANGSILSVDFQDPVTLTYVEKWRGFIDTIDVGTTPDPTVSLTALQGMFKLENYLMNNAGLVQYTYNLDSNSGLGGGFDRGVGATPNVQSASNIIKAILNT